MSLARTRQFQLKIERDDDGWHAWLPEVQGCRTWGRSLVTVRKGIREALATCDDVLGPRAVAIAERAEFDEEIVLPSGAQSVVDRRQAEIAQAVQARLRADAVTRESVALLHEVLGLSLRDMGAILGLSHETVKQALDQETERLDAARTALKARLPRPNPTQSDRASVAPAAKRSVRRTATK